MSAKQNLEGGDKTENETNWHNLRAEIQDTIDVKLFSDLELLSSLLSSMLRYEEHREQKAKESMELIELMRRELLTLSNQLMRLSMLVDDEILDLKIKA